MRWLILNKVPRLQGYLYKYLKNQVNFLHMNYRSSEDFDFFKPDRAILITNIYDEKSQKFIQDCKNNKLFVSLITEKENLKNSDSDLTFLIREKDNYLNKYYKNYSNYTNMHLFTPRMISWTKKKKKGSYNFLNNLNENHEDYIQPSECVNDIDDEIVDLKETKKINIYVPTYYRFEKTKSSIEDIIKLSKESSHDVKIYIGDNNTKIPEMKNWLKSLKEDNLEVYFSEKNIGKGMIVNHLDKNVARKDVDYIFSIDSDMRKETDNVFDKMLEILEYCANIGLVASNQSELSQHWYGKTVFAEINRGFKLGYTNDGIGISGGCICMRKKDWDTLEGYKENHDIYTGDDSILTYNIFRKLGMESVVADEYYMRHPKGEEDEKDYTEWKMKSWQRDNINFIKDNYTGKNVEGFFDSKI